MIVKVILHLKDANKEYLNEVAREEEIVGKWKGLIERDINDAFWDWEREYEVKVEVLEIDELR